MAGMQRREKFFFPGIRVVYPELVHGDFEINFCTLIKLPLRRSVYLPVILISFRNWSAVNQAFEHFSQAPVFEKR
jgi:hypothetical protein